MIAGGAGAMLDALPEPAFLLSTDGTILRANRAARRLCGPDAFAEQPGNLCDLAVDPGERVAAYLRRCSGSAEALVGALTLRGRDGSMARYRCHGAALVPAQENRPAMLLLRLDRGDHQFRVLTEKIAELNREILLRRRTQLRLEQALADKEVLIRELHHRVKNNLQMLLGLFALAEREEADARVRDRLRDSRKRLEAVGVVQRLLYPAETFPALHVATLLDELCASIRTAFGVPGIEVAVDAEVAPLSLDAAVPLGLIANELVTNALKHAFRGRETGVIRVTLRRDGARFRLEIEDDGIGFPSGMHRKSTSGLGLVAGLLRQLNGRMAREMGGAGGGTRWVIDFMDPGRTSTGQGL